MIMTQEEIKYIDTHDKILSAFRNAKSQAEIKKIVEVDMKSDFEYLVEMGKKDIKKYCAINTLRPNYEFYKNQLL